MLLKVYRIHKCLTENDPFSVVEHADTNTAPYEKPETERFCSYYRNEPMKLRQHKEPERLVARDCLPQGFQFIADDDVVGKGADCWFDLILRAPRSVRLCRNAEVGPIRN